MIGLADLLRTHLADIDADFRAHYGIDLGDVGTDALRWGRFGALLARLPADSHYMRTLSGRTSDWDTNTHLAVSTFEAIRTTNYLLGGLLTAHGAKKNPVAKPEPARRPGTPPKANTGIKSLFMRPGRRIHSG